MEVVLAHLEAARTVAHHGGLYHTNAEVKLQGESRALQTWASLYSLAPPLPSKRPFPFLHPSFLLCLPDSFCSSLFFLTHQFNKQLLVAGTRWTHLIQGASEPCVLASLSLSFLICDVGVLTGQLHKVVCKALGLASWG